MIDANSIRQIEVLSLNATPPRYEIVQDGWLIRVTGGATRRVNSVQPLYQGVCDVAAKIDFCESIYRQHSLPSIFKMTCACVPANLDDVLWQRGYEQSQGTWVQTCELTDGLTPSHAALGWSEPNEAWLRAKASVKDVSIDALEAHRRVVSAIGLPTQFMAIEEDGTAVACGFAVLQQNWIGLFDINTRIDCRNRGLGKDIVQLLMRWGAEHGASIAYLQVDEQNAPARHLYGKLGFTDAYRYWYRSKET